MARMWSLRLQLQVHITKEHMVEAEGRAGHELARLHDLVKVEDLPSSDLQSRKLQALLNHHWFGRRRWRVFLCVREL
eukprot:CAMPEP_0172674578 /NCGR_PEP_ID=MMETSP1074-20121228/12809_1 /TAXON_ID=2916 /ORGANISM="Ceratium fusus, Strain PA161109" /LENGTH=76 /DNA_ID=CAMNT_0013491993 /DNA_START=363 /DNA_END=593 /DNA_ORIENTATION=+